MSSAKKTIGEMVVEFYRNLFKGAIAVAIFGASITFSVIIQQINPTSGEPPKQPLGSYRFDYNEAQSLLATSWLLFVIALGLSSFSLGLLAFQFENIRETADAGGWHRSEGFAITASIFLQGLILTAFMFSALAICAYSAKPGWIAVGFIGFFCLVAILISVVQLYSMRKNRRAKLKQSRESGKGNKSAENGAQGAGRVAQVEGDVAQGAENVAQGVGNVV